MTQFRSPRASAGVAALGAMAVLLGGCVVEERRPPPPAPVPVAAAYWEPGHYGPGGRWFPGHWVGNGPHGPPPEQFEAPAGYREGRVWVPGHYDHGVWYPGGWER